MSAIPLPTSVFTVTVGSSSSDEPSTPFTYTFTKPQGAVGTPIALLQPTCNDGSAPDVFATRVASIVDNGDGTATLSFYLARVNPAGSTTDPHGWGMNLTVSVQIVYAPPGATPKS